MVFGHSVFFIIKYIAGGIPKTRTWYQRHISSHPSVHIYQTLSVMTVKRRKQLEHNGGRSVMLCRERLTSPHQEYLIKPKLESTLCQVHFKPTLFDLVESFLR